MRENINKVSQRGENLDSLQDKTDNLAVSAQGFRRGANRVRKDMWWKDMKMRVCLIICVIVLLIVIIVPSGKRSMEKMGKLELDVNIFHSGHRWTQELSHAIRAPDDFSLDMGS